MFDVFRSAVHASKALGFNWTGGYEALSHHEALYMATVGGAKGSHVTPKFPNHMIADAIDCVNEDCSEKSSVPLSEQWWCTAHYQCSHSWKQEVLYFMVREVPFIPVHMVTNVQETLLP